MAKKQELLRERLKRLLAQRKMTAMELARRADVKNSFVYDILNGKSLHPSGIKLAAVAEALEVSLSYLAGGTGEADLAAPPEHILIPRIEVRRAGGSGAAVKEIPDDTYRFHREWVSRLSEEPEALRLMRITGDSMSPSLEDGDTVLVDTSHTSPSPPGIFVLFDGLGLVAKRLEIVGEENRRRLRILSDNPKYSAEERPSDEARVVGRVVWFARAL